MRKLVLTFAVAALSAGVIFAQGNSSTVTQAGNGNDADVDQDGTTNTSIVDQTRGFGDGQEATIDQDGTSNFSDVLQDQSSANAWITQDGIENENRSKQSGFNDLDVYQDGDYNKVGGYSSIGNRAFQKNGFGNGSGDHNYADIDQLGSSNKAGLWQEHHGTATVYQNGDENDSRIYQSGSAGFGINSASVSIIGNSNSTDMHQYGEGNNASANIGPYMSNYNDVDMDQEGNGNNAMFGLQDGDYNIVKVDQLGNNNYTELGIKYGSSNEANYDVDGNGNRSRFNIEADWGTSSDGNYLDLTQNGDGNYSSGRIKGDGNDVDMVQDGNNNRIGTSWYTQDGVSITGDGNTVDIMQTSNGNHSFNTVTGNGNNIDVDQN